METTKERHDRLRLENLENMRRNATIFRKKYCLDGIKPILLFFLLDGDGATVSARVILSLEGMIAAHYDGRAIDVQFPRCILFPDVQRLAEYYENHNLSRDRAVVLFDGLCCNRSVKMLFADLARERFPKWSHGRARFGAMISQRITSEKQILRAARRLFDVFVKNFEANMENVGLPYGQPPARSLRSDLYSETRRRSVHASDRRQPLFAPGSAARAD